MFKSILNIVWRYSLWLTLPVSFVGLYLLGLSWFSFTKTELAIKPDQNKPFSHTLAYQLNSIQKQAISNSLPIKKLNPAITQQIAIFVTKKNLNNLNSNLPNSGKNYVPAIIKTDGVQYKAKLRYRGSKAIHWRSNKRSMRIKLDKNKKINGLNKFELLIPTTTALLDNYLPYLLAKQLKLLTSQVDISWLTLNGQKHGLYFMTELISEQTLINNKQMPGEIYSGEVAQLDSYQGADNHLFNNAGLWKKIASNSDYPKLSKQPLEILIELIHQSQINYQALRNLLNYESFATFHIFNQLINTPNIDDFHNWRLYFDHSRGIFFPIVWDAEGWKVDTKPIFPWHKLDKILLKDPIFISEIKHQQKKIAQSKLLTTFMAKAYDIKLAITPWVKADPNSNIGLNYYSTNDYIDSSNRLLERIKERFKVLISKWQKNKAETQINITHKTPIIWKGHLSFEGLNHITQAIKVEPGTIIKLGHKATLIFHQPITAIGNEKEPIIFTAINPKQPFGAIALMGKQANNSVFKHCIFKYGSWYKNALINITAMLSLHDVKNITIDHCQFSQSINADDMVHTVYSQFHISNSIFKHASGDALDIELSSALIENSEFHNNAKEGVDIMMSEIVIRNTRFTKNNDNALSIGQSSKVRVENALFKNNKTAILVKDASVLRLSNSTINFNKRALQLSHKNKHYEKISKAYLYHNQIFNNDKYFKINKQSNIYINDSYIKANFSSIHKGNQIQIDKLSDSNDVFNSKSTIRFMSHDKALFNSLDQAFPPIIKVQNRGTNIGTKGKSNANKTST